MRHFVNCDTRHASSEPAALRFEVVEKMFRAEINVTEDGAVVLIDLTRRRIRPHTPRAPVRFARTLFWKDIK